MGTGGRVVGEQGLRDREEGFLSIQDKTGSTKLKCNFKI